MRDDRVSGLQWALAYASLGWLVFPIYEVNEANICACGAADCEDSGKHPRVKRGFKVGTTDPAVIRQWWLRWPNANIGIATGAASGLVVLDVDPRHGGDNSIVELEAQHGDLPLDLLVRTGGAGFHVYFAHPDGRVPNRVKLGGWAGLDIRADGGYIVAPPSRHASGELYCWDTDPSAAELPPVPAWLMEMIRPAAQRTLPRRVQPGKATKIVEGTRNETLFKFACRLRAKGSSDGQILAHLERLNGARCDPPLEHDEVAGIANKAASYPQGKVATPTQQHTDWGNAKRLVARHGQDLRYCHAWKKWLVWDGVRWLRDATNEVERWAKDTVRAMRGEAREARGKARASRLAKHAHRSESVGRIRGMINLAASEEGVPVLVGELDQDPMLLTVANGTLDLKTGQLRPARREDLITKQAPVVFDAGAEAPLWGQFLDEVLGGDAKLIRFVQKAAGYALTGLTQEQCLFFLYGSGANGKTVFLQTLHAALGDYAKATSPDTLLARAQGGDPRNDLAALVGVRFVTASEVERGRPLAENLLKRLTGEDTISVRFLYGEFFQLSPAFKLFASVNDLPEIRGNDEAIWRRIRVIPFTITIPPERRDPRLREKLKGELPGILRWAVEGCLLWQQEGLAPPASVAAATAAYREAMDSVRAFIRARCVEDPAATVPFGTLFTAYGRWCEETGRPGPTANTLARRLGHLGFAQQAGTGGKRLRVGLRLREDDPSAGEAPDEPPFIVGEGRLGRRRAAEPQDHGP